MYKEGERKRAREYPNKFPVLKREREKMKKKKKRI